MDSFLPSSADALRDMQRVVAKRFLIAFIALRAGAILTLALLLLLERPAWEATLDLTARYSIIDGCIALACAATIVAGASVPAPWLIAGLSAVDGFIRIGVGILLL